MVLTLSGEEVIPGTIEKVFALFIDDRSPR
jgi:hypothetical protein